MPAWTDEQLRAINMRDRSVLLSAAAGSGKTAVLTERTIRALTDKDNPLDLSRMLAVTFTRAAAREMRERIGAALAEKIKEDPTNKRLARQMRLLPTAKISTIDSFCGDIVRHHAAAAGVSEGYRTADQQETDLIRIALMEGLIEDAYAGLIPDLPEEEFVSFVTRLYAFSEERNLSDTLLSLFERMETTEAGVATLRRFADAYRKDAETPLMDTAWGHALRTSCASVGNHFLHILNTTEICLPDTPAQRNKYLAYIEDYRQVLTLLSSKTADYTTLAAVTTRKFVSKPTGFEDDMPALRDMFDTFRKKYAKGEKLVALFTYTEDQWKTLFSDLARYTDVLYLLAREFVERELRESRRRGVYSFAQISRLAYSLLVKDGERTPLALALSKEYDSVSVDEYQDVSPLQHAVFTALAGERTRFLVGDIKQSIYRFRHADPSIFASLRRAFPSPDDAPESSAASLFMSLNFRCDPPVVNYVNHVFDTLFGVVGESIAYSDADRLGCGKRTDDAVALTTPTLAVFESAVNGVVPVADGAALTNGLPDAAHVLGGEENPLPEADDDDESAEEDERDIHTEAMWVASTIRDLLDNGHLHDGVTPVRPSDIAILIRAKNGKVLPYMEALQAYGVPAETPEATDFFSCPEVLLALSLLRSIDNPRRDIPLAATLLSPLYRLSADDLTLIRRSSPNGIPLYDALCAYCEAHPDFTAGRTFLAQLDSFRAAAENISVDRLIRRIMTETPLLSISGADGNGGDAKIRLLYHYALRFEGGNAGLYNFIHYINRQIETGKTFTPPAAAGKSAGVSVMTIHSSKGLEFPVVFLADCGKPFLNLDGNGHYLFDGHHPLAFRLRDESGLVSVKNPVHRIVKDTLAEETAEEEMRLLYVALTRAREKLYISGTLPAHVTIDDALDAARQDASMLSRFPIMQRNSYLKLLLLAYARCEENVTLLRAPEISPPKDETRDSAPDNIDPAEVARLADIYRTRFAYTYPRAYLTHIPGKLSVSRLTPSLLDASEEETTYLDTLTADHPVGEALTEDPHEKHRRMPEAWAGARPVDPTARGIVSHQFMQFCDFDRLYHEGVDAEVERMISCGYLKREEVAIMRPDELELFRKSSLLASMRDAQEVKREFRFHIHLPASHFTADPALAEKLAEESLLVQGVMDAVMIDKRGDITLVDYKTDRLTREELADHRLAAEKLRARHTPQLRYYAAAIERIFGKKPIRVAIYALQLGTCIDLCLD